MHFYNRAAEYKPPLIFFHTAYRAVLLISTVPLSYKK